MWYFYTVDSCSSFYYYYICFIKKWTLFAKFAFDIVKNKNIRIEKQKDGYIHAGNSSEITDVVTVHILRARSIYTFYLKSLKSYLHIITVTMVVQYD